MTKTVARCTFIVAMGAWLILSTSTPWVLSDHNTFLRGFVTHELLGFLGVVVTITLGSAANLHLTLNQIEERAELAGIPNKGFPVTRAVVKKSSFWLIGMLLIAIALVLVKPLVVVNDTQQVAAAFFNGAAVLIVLFNVLVLIDLTQTAFAVPPMKKPAA